MAQISSIAPVVDKSVNKKSWRNAARAVTLAVVAALLSACGTNMPPLAGIAPDPTGNYTLEVVPADAQVVLVEEGEVPVGRGASRLFTSETGAGVFKYELEPGRYQVAVEQPGYLGQNFVETLSAEDLTAAVGKVRTVVLVPDPSYTPPPGDVDGGELPGGTPGDDEVPGDGGDSGDDDGGLASRGYSLRGDPSFDLSSLTSEQRVWYERMWAAMADPDSDLDPDRMARSDDTYVYSRDLHNHLQTLLLVFRATGDMALLDEVYRLTEIMRDQLRDEWTGTLDGTDGTRDGYLGWAHRYGSYPEFEGKDTHETNEVKTHAIVATYAYAFHVNRDLGSKYDEAADFWQDYLVNHYEAKWRERKRKSSGYPILMRPHTHTYMSGVKYHYYMYRLTGNSAYLSEAERASNKLWDREIKTTSVDSAGSGYVWARSVLSEGGGENYLHPTTYARYVYEDAIELHLDGFGRWASADMRMFARPVAEWVIDREGARGGREWFASDIGGGRSRAGIPSDGDWKRLNTLGWSWTPYPLLAAWDESGQIADISVDALNDMGKLNRPGAVYIPAGLFLADWMATH